jgi:hypothetical protein
MKDKPDVDSNFQSKRPWVHPKDRELSPEDFDKEL